MNLDSKPIALDNKYQQACYEPSGLLVSTAGVLTGGGLRSLVVSGAKPVARDVVKRIQEINRGLSVDELVQIENSFDKTLKSTGLAKKGTEIIKYSPETADEMMGIIRKEFDKNAIVKFFPAKIRQLVTELLHSSIKMGGNAMYAFQSNKIVMPKSGMECAIFHELGHALNDHFGGFSKLLQKIRGVAILSYPIAVIALLKSKKAPNEEPKGWFDKTTTFVKENAGKLTFAVFLPVLAEEALASFKGNKLAKQVLTPKLASQVVKTNKIAYCSYLAQALLPSVGIFLGVAVRDIIAKPNLVIKDKAE